MRIVSGKFKGRAIVAPKGRGTRPTADRTRESVFNILAHADWAPQLDGARVIDLFAGSGALGLEAVSRGAEFCLFVETDAAARAAIRQNIETLELTGVTRLHRRSATALGEMPSHLGASFDLAFLDPPYNKDLVRPCLGALTGGNWLGEDAICIVETGADEALELENWSVIEARSYGAAKVWFLSAV